MTHRRFKEKCTSMYNNVTKHDRLWNTKDFKKNVRPCTKMHKNAIIDGTQEIFKKNVRPCTLIYQNTIIYQTQKTLRKMYIHVQ